MSANGTGTLPSSVPLGSFGEHEGHNVHPHRHVAPDDETAPVCSERWFCLDCRGPGGVPPGTWFDGPKCAGTVGKDGKR